MSAPVAAEYVPLTVAVAPERNASVPVADPLATVWASSVAGSMRAAEADEDVMLTVSDPLVLGSANVPAYVVVVVVGVLPVVPASEGAVDPPELHPLS